MALFHSHDVADYAQPQHQKASVCSVAESDAHTLLARTSDAVAEVFPSIQPGISYHYASAGLWSVHDLLFHLLRTTGPADLWIATWSMAEESVRMLVQGMDSGLIRSLQLLIDARVIRRNASAYAFVKAHADIVRVTPCHAKVTVLQNEAWHIAINGSPNYTNNPRIESGVVTTVPAVADFHRDWITAEMRKLKPFGETLKQTIPPPPAPPPGRLIREGHPPPPPPRPVPDPPLSKL